MKQTQKDLMIKDLSKKIGTFTIKELYDLKFELIAIKKISDNFSKKEFSEKSVKTLINSIKKININKRDVLVKLIDRYLPPFTDDKIRRDNNIINDLIEEDILKRFRKGVLN